MKKVVERVRNKNYYRVVHLPIWLWVYFVLPGHLTYALYLRGPDKRHAVWLAIVFGVCVWRGLAGRLPGVEPRPYVTHYGEDKPNLLYRVVCYSAAWIDLLVPFVLNLIGLVWAVASGRWMLGQLYDRLYYPLAFAVLLAAWFDWIPRARRSTVNEGSEKAWFYVAVWTVVPAQVAIWGAWRLGGRLGFSAEALSLVRLLVFLLVTALFLIAGMKAKLPRTRRYVLGKDQPATAAAGEF